MYTFNNKDLLIAKENYMYFPFYGKEFFLDYSKNRVDFIKKIQIHNKKINNLYYYKVVEFIYLQKTNYKFSNKLSNIISDYKIKVNINKTSKKISAYNFLNLKKNTIINTNDLLDFLIINAVNKTNSIIVINYLEKLIKKFEVSKKLYTNYSKDFKKKGRQYKFTQIYMKLSLLLTIEYIKKPNNRYLSTLLKLNDLISSSKLVLLEIFHDELLIIFELEKTFINNLIKKNKITI